MASKEGKPADRCNVSSLTESLNGAGRNGFISAKNPPTKSFSANLGKLRNSQMASERQIAANRRNAKKSTGPRSANGKARSRRNAFRHGLSIKSREIPASEEDVLRLAQLLSSAGENAGDAALAAAEADIDMLRIQKYRAALIEKWRASPGSFNLQEKLDALRRYERSAFVRRNRA
jgi:hypothetical protein